MLLTPGTRLGSYEILGLIGKGGMGEVYRAVDRKLGREVAIKRLPDVLSEDEERVARFSREARILASLEHPNIARLYGFEEAEGAHFLVMELVEGETLADRIVRGPMPVDEAAPLFKQIADALESAHEKGVIHRDLKPANIKVTDEGKVRVLDYGLAKVFEEEPVSEDLSHSPTLTKEGTRAGGVMGTAAYMSPEQTRGKRLDRRTDMWAFGCCLFEALTEKKAFDGETVTDIFAAIVRGEPDWNRLPKDVPPSIRVLLRRCLTKDRSRRFRDAGDAAIELEEALSESSLEVASPRPSVRWVPLIGLAAILLALGAGIGSLLGRADPPERSARRFEINLPRDVSLLTLDQPVLELSPNGEHLVYVASDLEGVARLYLRSLSDGETHPVSGTEGASHPFFSPDSRWIGFYSSSGLMKVGVQGGASIFISAATVDFGATWGPDDTIVYREQGPGLKRVSANGGDTETLGSNINRPRFLPDGKTILGATFAPGVFALSLDTGESKPLIQPGYNPRYVPTGHLLYGYEQSLYAVPFDVDAVEVTGDPVLVLESVRLAGGNAQVALANDGSLIYLPGGLSSTAERRLVWVDRDGNATPVTEATRAFREPRLSPDGTRIAVTIREGPQSRDIWLHDLGRDTLRRTTLGGESWFPIWTPDAKQLTFMSPRDVYQKPADGSAEATLLIESEPHKYPESWSFDGTKLLFSAFSTETGYDEWVYFTEDESIRSFFSSPKYDSEGSFSPDGKWVAYNSDNEVFVQSFADPGKRSQISLRGGREPVWTSKSGEIIYRNGRRIMGVSVETEPEFRASAPELLFEGPFELHTNGFRNFDVSADGQRFVMIQGEEDPPLDRFVVILDWFQELERLVPVED